MNLYNVWVSRSITEIDKRFHNIQIFWDRSVFSLCLLWLYELADAFVQSGLQIKTIQKLAINSLMKVP